MLRRIAPDPAVSSCRRGPRPPSCPEERLTAGLLGARWYLGGVDKPFAIPLPPQEVSREASVIALFVFIADLKRGEPVDPASKIVPTLIQRLRGLVRLPDRGNLPTPPRPP